MKVFVNDLIEVEDYNDFLFETSDGKFYINSNVDKLVKVFLAFRNRKNLVIKANDGVEIKVLGAKFRKDNLYVELDEPVDGLY